MPPPLPPPPPTPVTLIKIVLLNELQASVPSVLSSTTRQRKKERDK
jgi:hypothetical protein